MDNKAVIAVAIIVVLLAGVALSACGTVEEKPKSQIPNSKQAPITKSETPNSELETRINTFIKQLGSNDGALRTAATRELILIGKPAEPYVKEVTKSNDIEVKMRANAILKAIPVRERVKFSDGFLKEFPNIYDELGFYSDDVQYKFEKLLKIAEMDKGRKPLHNVTEDDIAGIIGEVLFDGWNGLSGEEKRQILQCVIDRGVRGAALYVVELLKDENEYVRSYAAEALKKIKAEKN